METEWSCHQFGGIEDEFMSLVSTLTEEQYISHHTVMKPRLPLLTSRLVKRGPLWCERSLGPVTAADTTQTPQDTHQSCVGCTNTSDAMV